jgi:A/G-specific adenine glycosylase
VWISEIILQQTQVVTAAPYFERFMERFPSVERLAAANLDEVLKAWQGLGYYRRARLLHQAAVEIQQQHAGVFPNTVPELETLPGVGPYTARAIAALAFGQRTVAVDGNVRRVGARLLANPKPSDKELQHSLEALLPREHPERGTEALIELGATVCSPQAPACERCPLGSVCLGRKDWQNYPAPRRRTAPLHVHLHAHIWLRGERVWLQRRPNDVPLGGQWGPPQGQGPSGGRTVATVQHAFTHRNLTVDVTLMPGEPPVATPTAPGRWADASDAAQVALSSLDQKILKELHRLGLLPWQA